jgi:hypothetical protein
LKELRLLGSLLNYVLLLSSAAVLLLNSSAAVYEPCSAVLMFCSAAVEFQYCRL